MTRPYRSIIDARDQVTRNDAPSYRVWRADPSSNQCPICEALDGTRVPIGQPFPLGPNSSIMIPPVHPGCRCRVAIVDGGPYESYEVTTEQDNPAYESYEVTRSDAHLPLHVPIALNAADTAAMQAAILRNDYDEASSLGKRAGYRGGCRCAECSAAHEHAQRVDADDTEEAAIAAMYRNYRNPRRT
jgi:hypothetical protein